MIRNFLKLPKKTVDALERRLAQFITADQLLWVGRADEDALREFAATWPSIRPQKPFKEPTSHERAQEILQRDFHGIAVAEKHFGAFTATQLEERKPLRLRDHRTGALLSEEATLALLQECKGDFVLCATHPRNLCQLHAKKKALFTADPKQPWFGEEKQRTAFSGAAILDPWVLARKAIVPESNGKTVCDQQRHLVESFPQERSLLPAEFANVAIIHFIETGEKIGGKSVIRFFVRAAAGHWLCVHWDGDQLYFDVWDGDAGGNVGSLSARTSYEPCVSKI